jgi:hypothetical protein
MFSVRQVPVNSSTCERPLKIGLACRRASFKAGTHAQFPLRQRAGEGMIPPLCSPRDLPMGPFGIKRDDKGWTVYDVTAEQPTTAEGIEQVGLKLAGVFRRIAKAQPWTAVLYRDHLSRYA